MLSKREVEGFLSNVKTFAITNFFVTFIISVAFFSRTVEASLIVALIGPALIALFSVLLIGCWYTYRLIKFKKEIK